MVIPVCIRHAQKTKGILGFEHIVKITFFVKLYYDKEFLYLKTPTRNNKDLIPWKYVKISAATRHFTTVQSKKVRDRKHP